MVQQVAPTQPVKAQDTRRQPKKKKYLASYQNVGQ